MEFIKEEIEIPKRTNSMIPFRPHSQTIDSKATRDSSIKRDSSGLIKQSSEKNINKIKDKSNNKIEKEKEKEKENDEIKAQNITEEKKENVSIIEKPKKNELTLVEFIDKIITDNYIKDNAKLILHFCQQCFSFIKLETIFNQITNTYENIKKENSVEKLKKLIIFINALFLEMISYYCDKKLLNNNISYAETFYCKLITDLIMDLKYNKEEKSEIQPFKLDIIENNTINDNNDKGKNIDNIYEINKANLIKVNLHNPEKKLEINIMNCRKSVKIVERKKEKEEKEEDSKKLNLRKSEHFSLNKLKVKDIIKEEDEKKGESDGEIEKEIKKSKKNSELNQNIDNLDMSFTDSSSEDEEEKLNRNNLKNIKDNKIIKEITKKENITREIITSKEKQLKHLKRIIILFDKIKKEEEIKVIEIKNKLAFYKILRRKKEKDKKKSIIIRQRTKRNTQIFSTSKFAIPLKKDQTKIIREYLKKGYFCVKDWKTEEIGNQLMLMSKESLNKIRPRELYKAIFLKKEKEITSPNVVNCINKFNRLTSFIMEDILSYNSPKDRAKAYEKWISIADYCRINKDYNDLIAIFSAFNHYVITGLKLTLKEVKTKSNNILNKIRNFCAVEGNYKKIRTEMDECYKNEEIFIPYLGMLLRDLNFFEEKSKYIDEKGNINFEKIEKINEMFEFYFKFRNKMSEDKNRNRIEELNFFEDLEDIKEEELEEIANNIEPEFKIKECKNQRKRLTKIDEKYFEKYKDNKEEGINSQQDLDEAFIL